MTTKRIHCHDCNLLETSLAHPSYTASLYIWFFFGWGDKTRRLHCYFSVSAKPDPPPSWLVTSADFFNHIPWNWSEGTCQSDSPLHRPSIWYLVLWRITVVAQKTLHNLDDLHSTDCWHWEFKPSMRLCSTEECDHSKIRLSCWVARRRAFTDMCGTALMVPPRVCLDKTQITLRSQRRDGNVWQEIMSRFLLLQLPAPPPQTNPVQASASSGANRKLTLSLDEAFFPLIVLVWTLSSLFDV